MKNAASATLQFSIKLYNIKDEKMKYQWTLLGENGNVYGVMMSDFLERENGWLNVEASGITLPDMTKVAKAYIKVEGDPAVDFLVDNVNLLI